MNIITPINQLGYGVAGLNIVKALHRHKRISLFPIGQINATNDIDASILKECLSNAQLFDYNDSCLRIWHQHDMSQFVGRGKKIGFPIFELNIFSALEKHHLNYVDEVFVCSQWAKEVCLNNLSHKDQNIHVIPLGVDIDIFKPSELNKSDKTIFFNCGKWEIRKGHDILVEIFNKAFNNDDNVELWMMCENPFLTKDEDTGWKKLYASSKIGHKVKFINRVRTQYEVYNIMQNIDCGIFPSRAEGWNLEALELLSCGKHIIITNFSAHTEFCNQSNAHLISINNLENAYDGKWFHNNGQWAKLDNESIDEAVEYMRKIHKLKQRNELNINQHGIETAQKYTWNNSSQEILKHV